MKRTLALVSGIAAVTLAGCASQVENKTASGEFTYLETQERASFVVPESVDSPEFSDEYEIPSVGESADKSLVGRAVYVQSPNLVLPVVSGSFVTEGTQNATVSFDQVDDSQPLDRAIWNSLLSYLDKNNVGVVSFDETKRELVTDWIEFREVVSSSWYTFTDIERVTRSRFKFTMDVKSHGRSAALNSELLDHEEQSGSREVKTDLNALQTRRQEIEILNKVIGHYENQIRQEAISRIAEIRQGIRTEMGFDDNGEPAFVVNAKYDIAWPRLLLVLRKLGFNVKDLDKSTGLLFVSYNGEESSWWNNFWSSDDKLLDESDYRLRVRDLGAKTSITFMNEESQPFGANQVVDLFEPFSEIMSEDNLDI